MFLKGFSRVTMFPSRPSTFSPSFFFLPDTTRRRRWDCTVSGRGNVGRGHRVEEDQTNAEEVDEKKEIGVEGEARDGVDGRERRFF